MLFASSIWNMNKKLIKRYERSNYLFSMLSKLYKYVFDYRNGDLCYSELKELIKKEMRNV